MIPVGVLLLFVGSGAAALIYEIVWLQSLQLVVGSSTISLGVLLGTFMGGMCLGSFLAPRVISPARHPLRVYAALELGIGAAGILLLFVMPLVGRVYFAWGGNGFTGLFLRAAVAGICLLPPTLAMGATLPAVARWTDGNRIGVSWLGFFYAGNLAGAVFGSLVAGFVLLRVYDVTIATLVAATLNVLVAAGALRLAAASRGGRVLSASARRPAHASFGETRRSAEARRPSDPHAVHLAIALSGFCALAAEVIWTRHLGLLFGATVYTFSIVLAIFLIGLGLGSAAGSALARRASDPRRLLGWCQMLSVGAIAWTAWTLGRSLPYWPVSTAISADIWATFRLDFLRGLWAILPGPVLWGASFPLALAAMTSDGDDPGRRVGGLYAANTIGAICGSLSASFVLVAWLGSQRAQQVMMALAGLAALLMLAPPVGSGFSRMTRGKVRLKPDPTYALRGISLASALIAAALVAGVVPPIPPLLVAYGRHAANWTSEADHIFYVGEGLQSSVAVSRTADGVLNYHNAGKIEASSQPQDMRLQRMLGHITTLVPADPRSILVVGCGAGVTAGAASIDPAVERLTIVEIEPLVPRVVSTHFSAQNHDVIRNPKVHVQIDDARHYLFTTRETFDAITSDPLDPWVKNAATLYTKEFWEAAKRHLNPGGVVSVFVQLYESSPEAVKSEIATFFTVFPQGFVVANVFDGRSQDTVLVGQVDPFIDLDQMDFRLRHPRYAAVARSLGEVGIYSIVDLLASYAGNATDLKEWLRDAAINTDRSLRLQYLAGLGFNQHVGDRIYADMLQYRRFPEELFWSSGGLVSRLRQVMVEVRE